MDYIFADIEPVAVLIAAGVCHALQNIGHTDALAISYYLDVGLRKSPDQCLLII